MFDNKRTKIVCTLGPATEDDEVLRNMLKAGMNVARLNFSHGTHEYHRKNIERVRRIAAELNKHVAIMTDTKGPEIRTRLNEGGTPIELRSGETIRITSEDVKSTQECIALDYAPLPNEVGPGDAIYIDDGLLGFKVLEVTDGIITCLITNGGKLGERKGVNLPTVNVALPSVSEHDREDIRFSCEMGVDAIAASFIRDAQSVREIRDLCKQYGAKKMQVISKIESAFAVQNFDSILAESDGIMVARGDLGIEIPPADVPAVQHGIITKCNKAYKPVIIATQMLDSMTTHPRPTRAEVSDVAVAIVEGSDCVMLSGETAAGKYPLQSVQMMTEICQKVEMEIGPRNTYQSDCDERNVSDATGFAAVQTAGRINAKALLCPTISGYTARIMSSFKPRLPIIAASPDTNTLRRCAFYWGVEGIETEERSNFNAICKDALDTANNLNLLEEGDIVVITVGDPMSSPISLGKTITSDTPTNIMIVAEVM